MPGLSKAPNRRAADAKTRHDIVDLEKAIVLLWCSDGTILILVEHP
jgi:hypothetical protein